MNAVMDRTGAKSGYVVDFLSPLSDERGVVGGKAASLGKLAKAGFPVPPGFTVTTEAFSAFLDAADLRTEIAAAVARLDFGDAAGLEVRTAAIRELIQSRPIPADVEAAIRDAYAGLGEEGYVAVRSSATAEDMEDASFAGLHDTYLDIRGGDDVLAAVRRCWASLWTARCASYRERGGIDHEVALIAVVVQTMVTSEVAGVLFTANPLTAATDEYVVNASWGLGEGVVSGILTPDEYLVDSATGRIRRSTPGAKQVAIVRNPDGPGTVEVEVDEERRALLTLSDEQVAELAALGTRVMAFYGGFPQDIEWALARGELYLLQSRNVTGVEFLWDEDMDAWQWNPDDPETVWSHAWAEAYWTGGITPLFYSIRARELASSDDTLFRLWGFDDLVGMRRFKYRRATAYFSSTADKLYYQYILPPALRPLGNLPPTWHEEAAAAPFSVRKAIEMHLRNRFRAKNQGPYRFIEAIYSRIEHGAEAAEGPAADELRRLSDEALEAQAWRAQGMAKDFFDPIRPGFHVYAAATLAAVGKMLRDWYTGENAFAFQDVISGLPRRTIMVQESIDFWETAQRIRRSPHLSALLEQHRDADFFERLEDDEEGRRFLAFYRERILGQHGHRGHADRDIWFPRRSEDPSLDYRALRALVAAGDTPSPEESEKRLVEQRLQTTAEVLANLREKRFGRLRAWIFQKVLAYVHTFLVLRDDERHYIDRVTMAKKRAFQEVGRRLVERGILASDDDFYFLPQDDLWALLHGRAAFTPLLRAKIDARRRMFVRYNAREESPPPYLAGNEPLSFEEEHDDSSGLLRGTGTSRGSVTGRARVVPDLKDIGRLEKGDILVCNATDPGWASVFALISGLVMETGGMLAHGACLSREYGLPAVTLPNAIQRIPDGATISVVGDTGEVQIVDAEGGAGAPAATESVAVG